MVARSSFTWNKLAKESQLFKRFWYPIEQKQLNTVNSIETYYYYFH